MKIVVKIKNSVIKGFTAAWDKITEPFVSFAVLLDESRRENLDGSWDRYWEKKNRKMRKRERRRKAANMQSVINRLAKAYDDGRMTRWDIKQELLALVTEGRIPKGSVESLFDLIIG